MGIINLLASSNYMIVNKVIARKFGIESAILLGELCSWQQYYNNKEFAKDKSTLINSTCLTEYSLNNAIKILKDNNIISVTRKGLPATNYYLVNEDTLEKILDVHLTRYGENESSGYHENETTISNNNINNNTILNNNILNNTLKENSIKESNDMAMTCHSTTATKSKETKHKYGEYKNVLLTDTELNKLNNEYGEEETQNAITYLDEYIEMKGAKYKSHYLAIRKWVFDALKRHKKEEEKGNSMWDTLNKVFEDDE